MEDKKEIRTVNAWIYRKDLAKGFTIANAKFKHEYSRLSNAFRKNAAILYFLNVGMGIRYVARMQVSAKNQAAFCRCVCGELNTKKVEPEHIKVFTKDVKALKKRLDTIDRIIKEDIHLTEYEPFFNELGDRINDIDFNELPQMAKDWNASHPDIVKAHMKEVQPEIDRHNEFLRRKHEAIKAEKAAAKAKKKAEDEEVMEIKRNAKKNRAEYRRIERSFEPYYTGRR